MRDAYASLVANEDFLSAVEWATADEDSVRSRMAPIDRGIRPSLRLAGGQTEGGALYVSFPSGEGDSGRNDPNTEGAPSDGISYFAASILRYSLLRNRLLERS